MSDKRGGAPRARLVDMEVQEVSLVDRAANKRKFLVVKRSEGMAQEGNADAGEGTGDTESGELDGEEGHADGEGSPLDVAATALEGLTGAMTRLQSAATDTQRAELGNVIQELRDAADALEGIGASDDAESDEDETDEHQLGSTDAPRAGGDLAVLVGAMTELVTELRASRTGQHAAKAARRGAPEPDDEDEDDDSGDSAGARRAPARPGAKRKSGGKYAAEESTLEQDVRALRGELKAFTGAIQEQARRLSKLEKRAAPPASRPPGERPSSPSRGSDEGAWPLDLNASPRR